MNAAKECQRCHEMVESLGCHTCVPRAEPDECEHDFGMFDVCRKCGYYGGHQPGA